SPLSAAWRNVEKEGDSGSGSIAPIAWGDEDADDDVVRNCLTAHEALVRCLRQRIDRNRRDGKEDNLHGLSLIRRVTSIPPQRPPGLSTEIVAGGSLLSCGVVMGKSGIAEEDD